MLRVRENIILALSCVIVGLIAVIVIMWLSWPKDTLPTSEVKTNEDQITVRQHEIIELMHRESALIEQRKSDSVRHASERKSFIRQIKRYKDQLAAVNFDKMNSAELDSIRHGIYYDGDSLKSEYQVSGYDSLYAMPISQARDALEAKARESVKDSVIIAQGARIDGLEAEVRSTEESFKKQILLKDDAMKKQQEISGHMEALKDHYKTESKKQKGLRWLDRIGAGLAGFGLGRLKS